ncbi:MAG: hypothetical protein ACI8RZ_000071 [Myxococcota bacterium]|jgi:hypothetical protein
MNSRRDILKTAGLGAAALALTSASQHRSIAAFARGEDAGAPWWLMAPLSAGSSIGGGWSLAGLSPVAAGASVLTVAHRDGRQTRVHLCTWSEAPRGVAHTALLDMVVMDGGQGDQPTEESLGRALRSLASRIRRNELDSGVDLAELARMQSHEERVARYGPESLV